MGRKILFITPAPYNQELRGKSLYESFDLMAKGVFDPKIRVCAKEYIEKVVNNNRLIRRSVGKIYVSTSRRSLETAEILKKVMGLKIEKIKSTSLLDEIGFKMEELISEKEFNGLGVDLARKRFFERFLDSQLSESKESVVKRIKNLVGLLIRDIEEDEDILCCSHSFFMKVIEVFLADERTMSDSGIFLRNYNGLVKAYSSSCEGFELESNELKDFDWLRRE